MGWVLLAHQLLLQRIRFAGFASLLENAVTGWGFSQDAWPLRCRTHGVRRMAALAPL